MTPEVLNVAEQEIKALLMMRKRKTLDVSAFLVE
jgi:hypothetical protein